jgi:hypothetical protein
MDTKRAIEHLDSVDQYDVRRYVNYLDHIKPKSEDDIFRRWLFAYASVHTSWQLNCKLYAALADLTWMGDKVELATRIRNSGAGLHNNRTRFIWSFTDYYWKHPMWFNRTGREPWDSYRARIEDVSLGLGFAKSAFGVELVYLQDAEIMCTDTHVLQMYGYSTSEIKMGSIPKKAMTEIQAHWVDACVSRAIPPVVGRWLFWDTKQNQPDPRYWTFVFEQENYNERLEFLTNHSERRAALPGYGHESPSGGDCAVSSVHEAVPHALVHG